MAYSNCLIVALALWQRHGGYVVIRRSRHTWVPHFMWTKSIEGLEVIEYKPVKPHRGRLFKLLPVRAILFRGRMRRGVGEEAE